MGADTVFQLRPCCGGNGLYYSTNGGEDFYIAFYHAKSDVFRPLTIKNKSDTLLVGWDNILVLPDCIGSPNSRDTLDLPGTKDITAIEVSKYDDAILYAARAQAFFYWNFVDPSDYSNSIFKSENNGSSWNDISANFMGLYAGYVSDFETNPFNPNEVWVSLAISSSNSDPQISKKIYRSTNGGNSWTAYVEGPLPEFITVSKIEFDKDEYVLYIATDIGVYYRKLNMSGWYLYGYQLPKKIVTDLEINQSAAKVRIGTLGRGIWETPTITTYDSSPYSVTGTEDWTTDQTIYSDIEITGSLSISFGHIITMHPQASITVKSGGTLELRYGGIINHADITVESGGTLLINTGGKAILYDDDEVQIELGATSEIENGSIEIEN